jgi:hypothetical protein
MVNVMELLNEKNDVLARFHDLNEQELLNFADGNFDRFELFYQERENLLEIIKTLDDEIGHAHLPGAAVKSSDDERARVLRLMDVKNDLVQRILAQDLQILSLIETAKSEIIRELRTTNEAKKAIGGYKVTDTQRKLNEKA